MISLLLMALLIPLLLAAALAMLPLPMAGGPFPVARRGRYIKQFEGPGFGSGVVCFKFWELVPAWGCPYECAYCFLQTNPHARMNEGALGGVIYGNWRHMLDEVDLWLASPTPRMLIVGELQDGLVFDGAYAKVTGKPLTHHLVPLFARQDRHRLIFLTKSVLVSHALELEPTPQVVFSWSVNAEYVSRRWEKGAPPPAKRFGAAERMKKAGWPVRLRLDPMVPYEDGRQRWRDGYARAIDRINGLGPEMVTIGALRATDKGKLRGAAEKNGREAGLFDYLSEKDPSGFKHRLPFEAQVEMFRFALGRLDRKRTVPALCKEDASVWRAVGLGFNGCHCLLGGAAVPAEILSTDSHARVPLPRE
jgi:spore photoproduct lyase